MAKDIKLAKLFYEINAETAGLKQDLQQSEAALGKFAKFVVANPVLALGALGTAALGVGIEAAKMAGQVDQAMRDVANAVPGAETRLRDLKRTARELSDEFGIAQTEIAAQMKALSATGIDTADDLIAATRASITAQQASGQSFEAINAALDASLENFGLAAKDANAILAQLLATAKGKTNLQDLGDLLVKFGPDAKAAGLSLGETATAIAKVATQGGSAKQQLAALTGLLAKEGAAGVRAFAGEVIPAAVAVEAMQAAADRTKGSLGSLGDQVRARLNNVMIEFGEKALPIAIKGLELLNEVLGHFTGSTKATAAADTIDSILKSIDSLGAKLSDAGRKQAIEDLGKAMRDLAGGPGGALRNTFDAIGHGITSNLDELGTPALTRLRDGLAKTVEAGELTTFELGRVRESLFAINGELLRRGDRPLMEAPPPEVGARLKSLIATVKGYTAGQKDAGKAAKDTAADEKTLSDRRQVLAEITNALNSESDALLETARRGLEKLREEMILAGGEVEAVDALLKPLNDKLGAIEKRKLKAPVTELKLEVGNVDDALKAVDATLGDIAAGFEPIELTARDTALAVGDIALEALAAAEQFGIISGEAYTALGHIIDLGVQIDALKNASFTQVLAGLPGIVGSLSGLLGTVFGESPADQERKRILRENTERLRELAEVNGDLVGLQSTGKNLSGIAGALSGIGFPGEQGKIGQRSLDLVRDRLFDRGLTFSDLAAVAKDLGITIRDKDGNLLGAALNALLHAIEGLDTGIANTFRNRRQGVDDEIALGIRGADTRFAGLLEAAGPDNAITRALDGIDASTPTGRTAAADALRRLFTDLNAGKIDPKEFGDLSRDEFSDLIRDLIGILVSDAAIKGAELPRTPDRPPLDTDEPLKDPVVLPPIEVGADVAAALDDLLGAGSPAVDYLAEIVANTAAFRPIAPPHLPPGPNTLAASGPGVVLNGGIHIALTLSGDQAADPRATAAAMSDALVEQIDRALYDQYRQARATAGHAGL